MATTMATPNQYVCTACGFNVIGFQSKRCRFCGATPDYFLTAKECSEKFKLQSTPINDKVTQLKLVPSLGYEHIAYCIKTSGKVIWIDCLSSFDFSVVPMDYILFTHNDFLGASNLYRQHFNARVWIHARDAAHPNSRFFTFDRCFFPDDSSVHRTFQRWERSGVLDQIWAALVVERTLGWLSKCRAILVRYDKKACNYLGFIKLACALLWYRRCWRLATAK